MVIQGLGVSISGLAGLDTGLRDLVLHTTVQGTFVIAHSGRNGGFVTYQVGPDGALTPVATRFYGADVMQEAGRDLVIAQFNGEAVGFFGSNSTELVGYRVNVDGTFGPLRRAAWSALESQIADGGADLLTAWTLLSSTVPPPLPGGGWHVDTVALHPLSVGGTPLLLAGSSSTQEVLSFLWTPGTQASPGATLGSDSPLGMSIPVAIEVVSVLGSSFAVVAGAGSSSLSVLQVGADGSLVPRDHVLDNGLSRFQNVQALASVTVGDHAFVVAAGADDGVSLFRLLPGGHLMFIDAIADQAGLSLDNVISLEAVVLGSTLHIYAGSQSEAGVTRLSVDLGQLGVVAQASISAAQALAGGAGRDVLRAGSSGDTLSGGAGDDILIAGPGETVLFGGAGADRFAVRVDTTLARIQDFERGVDMLDLSHLPMLRNPGQLAFTALPNGAEIVFRDTRILLSASDNAPLALADIFPQGFTWTDRAYFMDLMGLVPPYVPEPDPPPPPPPPPPPGPPPPPPGLNQIIASAGGGTFLGTPGNDLFTGSAAADVFFGGAGDDVIHGNGGNDWLAGGDGNDLLLGGAGNDTLFGDGEMFATGFRLADEMDAARSVFRLYQATLNRAPDPAGLIDWTQQLATGARSLQQVASGFVESVEFQTLYGPLSNSQFVTLLYTNVLGRAPDAAGFADWMNALARGVRRADVVLGFSESAEFRNRTEAAANAYVNALTAIDSLGSWGNDTLWGGEGNDLLIGGWGNDHLFGEAGNDVLYGDRIITGNNMALASSVYRLYRATLDREPDRAGLESWVITLERGASILSVVTGFIDSVEFRSMNGALNNSQFVTLLYNNVLGRAPDPGGLASWTSALAAGTSRAEVVRAFAESAEFVQASAQPLKAWMRAQGVNDVLDGGSGDNWLWGGGGADVFVFQAIPGSVHRVGDFEPWDFLDMTAFNFANAGAARARMSQVGSDVFFLHQGVEVRLLNTQIGQLQDDNFLI